MCLNSANIAWVTLGGKGDHKKACLWWQSSERKASRFLICPNDLALPDRLKCPMGKNKNNLFIDILKRIHDSQACWCKSVIPATQESEARALQVQAPPRVNGWVRDQPMHSVPKNKGDLKKIQKGPRKWQNTCLVCMGPWVQTMVPQKQNSSGTAPGRQRDATGQFLFDTRMPTACWWEISTSDLSPMDRLACPRMTE